MAALFASGRIVDAILLLMLLEFLALLLWRAAGRVGPHPLDVLPYLLSGAALMVALRMALTGAGWQSIATCLLAAFAAHLLDLYRRWPTRG